MSHPIIETASRRAVILDGAMGTEIQQRDLSSADFEGLEGLNEILVLSRPDVILDIHRAYLEAGSDIVETNSFSANSVVLREYGQEGRVSELNRAAARLARRAADEFSTPDRPRWVSGSVGPGTRLPSLGQIEPADLGDSYREQVQALLEGGVDLLQIETCQDPLQARIAVMAARDAMDFAGRVVPVFCEVTIDRNGTMLLGTEPMAALTTLSALPGVDVFGINCAVGPEAMHPVLVELSRSCPLPLAVLPNAGLPETVDGRIHYRLSPDDFARSMKAFVDELGVAFVGGCCGTTPAHIAELARALRGVVPAARRPSMPPSVSSLFVPVSLSQEPRPLIVGERTNANGSKVFRDRLALGDIEGMVAVAREQAGEGAHLLDVSMAFVGRDEAADVADFVSRMREVVESPLMIDSTEASAIDAALQRYPGRAIVNSVNLEDGGARLDMIASMARRHGAAIVALTIDETGMAMSVDRKLDVARRLVERLCGVHGFRPEDVLLDVLTFTLASGDPGLRDAGARTIEAVRRVKAEFPGVFTSLGVSNVSFGLKPPARRVLNSVFLHHCVQAGLDAAILNAGRVLPLAEVPEDLRRLAEEVIFPPSRPDRDSLEAYMEAFDTPGGAMPESSRGEPLLLSAEDRIRRHVIRGDRTGIENALQDELARRSPVEIINEVLLDAMRTVGERFGRGEMQLPFVLRSAEAMKEAVAFLEPRMEQVAREQRGTLVLATVAGDVHDIGKNLVDIILSNNGYRVVNLGIKQPIEGILAAAVRERADAIGLSGLLVKSTLVMRDNLAEMKRKGFSMPVLVGGAALNRRFTDADLSEAYGGPVVYCADAFDGLAAMDRIAEGIEPVSRPGMVPVEPAAVTRGRAGEREVVPTVEIVPEPPFMGFRLERSVDPAEVARWVNRTSLFRFQWQFKKGGLSDDEWRRRVETQLEPMFAERLERYVAEGIIRPQAIWGFMPANRDGESVVLFDESGTSEIGRFDFPRQDKAPGLCLADYLLPVASGRRDILGLQVVTAGPDVSRREASLFEAGEYLEYLYLHGIGVEMAEACAEWAHRKIREGMQLAEDDAPAMADVLRKGYRGCRYSFGYPACPDIGPQALLLDIMGAARIGVSMTENSQLVPEQSTSALVFHHPRARYFAV